jgi:short-chain Z-isoprenyl diphosphate synthase
MQRHGSLVLMPQETFNQSVGNDTTFKPYGIQLSTSGIPRHVGVILDGNRRWAKKNGAAVGDSYRRGAEKVARLLDWCDQARIEFVTLWALSIDNMQRSTQDLGELTDIIVKGLWKLAQARRWRLKPIGALDLLSPEVAMALHDIEEATKAVDGMLVNIAIAYDGHEEIISAVRELLHEGAGMGLSADEIGSRLLSQEGISRRLFTRDQPPVDLVIRTSGEQRLSGFLLWQVAHAELYFCNTLWPDFEEADFRQALRAFEQRQRRFGA